MRSLALTTASELAAMRLARRLRFSANRAGSIGRCRMALSRKTLQRAIVVGEVDVFVGRRRFAAPAAFDFGAQCQHVAKALHVEARVGCDAEFWIGHQLPRLR